MLNQKEPQSTKDPTLENPYEPPIDQQLIESPREQHPFLVGFRNGFLWSLLVAIPGGIGIYGEMRLEGVLQANGRKFPLKHVFLR